MEPGRTPLDDAIRKSPVFKMPPGLYWMTTSPNPRSRQTGYDAGQRGWRLHAIEWTQADNDYHERTGFTRSRKAALCGLQPAHGWGVDLFIEDECERCSKTMDKRDQQGTTSDDRKEKASAAERQAREEPSVASTRRTET